MAHIPFLYKGVGDIAREAQEKNLNIPIIDDFSVLGLSLGLKKFSVKNRFLSQPMETCDANPENGTPSMLTYTKYERIAKGGSAIIWIEAIAITPESRSNPYQLYMTDENVGAFKKLVDFIKKTGLEANGFEPIVIAQLNHSGRYTKKDGKPAPRVMYLNPLYEKSGALAQSCVVTDDELRQVEIDMGNAARLAQKAGFDGADIKACHRYLLSESLSAFNRPGHYGGDFINRTRLFRNCIESAQAATKDYYFTTRMNIYDGCEYPYGFGMKNDGSKTPDLAEPLRLATMLCDEYGFDMLNVVCGNPYVNPDVSRPYSSGAYIGDDPLTAISRGIELTKQISHLARSKNAHVVISSLGYLRQYIPYVAAGILRNDCAELIGLGRPMLAYPDLPNDVLTQGKACREKSCVTCSKCAVLKANMLHVGCVARDSENFDMKGSKKR